MNTRYQISICAGTMILMMLGMTQPDRSQPTDHGAAPERHESMQPEPENARPGPGDRPRLGLEVRIDPESLRERLSRSILRYEELAQRSQAAIEKLDSGASPSEVLAELRWSNPQRGLSDEPRNQPQRPERGGPDDPRRDRPMPAGISDREELMGFLKEQFPDLWANLTPILEQNPRSAERLLGRMAPQIREIIVLSKAQPELARIKTEQMRSGMNFVEASRTYRVVMTNPDATQQEKDDALDKLRRLAAERFDHDLRAKQFEISRLEARLIELRDSVDRIEQARDMEIDHMVNAAIMNAKRQSRPKAGGSSRDPEKKSGDD